MECTHPASYFGLRHREHKIERRSSCGRGRGILLVPVGREVAICFRSLRDCQSLCCSFLRCKYCILRVSALSKFADVFASSLECWKGGCTAKFHEHSELGALGGGPNTVRSYRVELDSELAFPLGQADAVIALLSVPGRFSCSSG